MPVVSRSGIAAIALPRSTEPAPEIGGDVVVQGMDMPQMLEFTAARRRLGQPQEGETEEQAAERTSGEMLPRLLAVCVLAEDGLPVYSVAQWRAFGARHPDRAVALWEVAIRLSGQAPDDEKKA